MYRKFSLSVLILAMEFTVAAAPFEELGQHGPLPEIQSMPPAGWTLWQEPGSIVQEIKLSSAEHQRKFAVVVNDWMQPASPIEYPAGENEIRFFAAQGEYEPAAFAVRAAENIELDIAVTPLKSQDGTVISTEYIELRSVYPLRLNKNAFSLASNMPLCSKQYYYQPTYMEIFSHGKLAANTTRQFHLTAKVPDDTASGIYRGKITLSATPGGTAEIPIMLRVLPFRLQIPPRNYGAFFLGNFFSYKGRRNKHVYPQTLNKIMVAQREHGLNSISLYEVSPELKYADGKISADFHETEKIIDAFTAAGMKGAVVLDLRFLGWWVDELATIVQKTYTEEQHQYTIEELNHTLPGNVLEQNITKRWKKGYQFTVIGDTLYRRCLRQLQKNASEKHWPPLLLLAEEELTHLGIKLAGFEHYIKIMHEEKAKTVLVDNFPHQGIDSGRNYKEWVDIRQYNMINPTLLQNAREDQRDFWIYNRGWNRLAFGFYAYRIGAGGVHQWADQWMDDPPYTEFASRYWCWTLFYPAPDGPLPTVWSEQVREGIDDAAYVYTLDLLIRKALESSVQEVKKQAVSSQSAIKRLMSKMPVSNDEFIKFQKEYHTPEYLADRWMLADEIIKLQKLIKDGADK